MKNGNDTAELQKIKHKTVGTPNSMITLERIEA